MGATLSDDIEPCLTFKFGSKHALKLKVYNDLNIKIYVLTFFK